MKEKVLNWVKNQKEKHGLLDIKIDIPIDNNFNKDTIYKSFWEMINAINTGNYIVIAESN